VRSGKSAFVRSGKKRRLENPGKVTLEVIEAQLSEYLAEDDIVRFGAKNLNQKLIFPRHFQSRNLTMIVEKLTM